LKEDIDHAKAASDRKAPRRIPSQFVQIAPSRYLIGVRILQLYCANRSPRAPHLVREPESLVARKTSGFFVNRKSQIVSFLPGLQILVISHLSSQPIQAKGQELTANT
jgi:hypothetical protein